MEILSIDLITFAHFLIGFYFVFFGFWNIYHWRPTLSVMSQKNIPHPYLVLPVGVAWQVIFGSMIALGVYVKLAALLLIPFVLISIFIFHAFWKLTGELRVLNFIIFLSNLIVTIPVLLLLIAPIAGVSDFFLI